VSEKIYVTYRYKIFVPIFHLFAEKLLPPWADLHKILREGSSSRRNQLRQILFQSNQGFWFCGVEFLVFP